MTRVPSPSPSLPGLRPMVLPASLLTALLAVLLTVPVAAAALESPPAAVQTPDIESLRPRAEEFWRLLFSGDRVGASQFVRPVDRPEFLQGREQRFTDPTVETIELSEDATGANVGISFDMLTPVGVFPWKARQVWTVVDGEWMSEYRRTASNPFSSRPSPPDPE